MPPPKKNNEGIIEGDSSKGVVGVELLEALDGLIWLRTGHQVASRFNLNQSTVSRNSKKCAQEFCISLVRRQSEWSVEGDPTLLNLERYVHQVSRWRANKPLRLEAQHWSAPPLLCANPQWLDRWKPEFLGI